MKTYYIYDSENLHTNCISVIKLSDEKYNELKNYIDFLSDSDPRVLSYKEMVLIKNNEDDRRLKISDIKSQIQTLEFKCLRPLREGDTKRVTEIDAQIKVLRDEIKLLEI